ncbi:MAG: SMC family ATPase, partial [Candidatus Bathyarchaeota archaeon]|nr:SMC family ATPase [Candidatus Bathyarchaeota archaeon]
MKLRKLRLKNIRSYVDEEIEFPDGVTLFEGDIGSGKSTLLLAVEYALFGLGSEKGEALLRVGERHGEVTLTLDVNGKTVEVHREIERKGRGIQQSNCHVIVDGVKKYFSASEMKEWMLQTLGFNEPVNPRAQSFIFRYAVFTPQEEMKAILWMNAEERMQTLRKAFRIEDYRVARDNALQIARMLERQESELKGKAADLPLKQRELEEKKQLAAKSQSEVEMFMKEKAKLEQEAAALKQRVHEHRLKVNMLSGAAETARLLKERIAKNASKIEQLRLEKAKLQSKISQEESRIEVLKAAQKPTDKSKEDLEVERDGFLAYKDQLQQIIGAAKSKLEDYQLIREKGECPTCDRPVDPAIFEVQVNQKRAELQKLEEQLAEANSKISAVEVLMKKLAEYERIQQDILVIEQRLLEYKAQISRVTSEEAAVEHESFEAEKMLNEAVSAMSEHQKLCVELAGLEQLLEEKNREIIVVGNKQSAAAASLQMLQQEIQRVQREITEKAGYAAKAQQFRSIIIWLTDYYAPSVETIERNVLAGLHEEFNEHFKRWFSILIDDQTKDAYVDENFTPIVTQDNYEQDVAYLSGGEKTSVALAYRLALNSVMRSTLQNAQVDLLILDEPTDGFSREQLYKVRDILDELKLPQIIIVSHERELESFADNILQVQKVNGASKINAKN